jgi:hypothetical protein
MEERLIAFALVRAFNMMLKELSDSSGAGEALPRISFDGHSLLMKCTQRSANAFGFGLRPGKLRG